MQTPLPPLSSATAQKIALSGALPFRCGGSEAGLPQRFKILNWGETTGRTSGAKIIVGKQALSTVPRYHAALGLDKTLIDYEHQSHEGHPNYLPDPRPVPGHGKIEVIEGEGVFLSSISYTPNGQQHAANYADVSAVAHLDDAGNLLYVSSVALTQYGDVAGMEFAEHVAALSARSAAALTTKQPNTTTTTMEKTDPDYRAMLIKLLKLEPDESGNISDESIHAALSSTKDETVALSTAKGDAENIVTMSAVNARFDERERQDIIREASAEGKVIPLSNAAIAKLAPADLRGMVDKLPAKEVALSTDAEGKPAEKPSEKTVALSATDKIAAKALGLTEAEYAAGK